ncbi:MAG: saccharopine dehydrogenase [Chitinophagaceae bacterium]|nr:MAG: saccharopine dehydrogenase [Chitinophagaceae bacterium]
MKKIILFGAGKSATYLIDYLKEQSVKHDFEVTVIDADYRTALFKVGNSAEVKADTFDINDSAAREKWIPNADLVISLLPPALHILVAKDCIRFKKPLLYASYISPEMRALENDIKNAGILFMGEMGLDPGIDHMSAMKMLDAVRAEGGKILSFKGYCGALMAPGSDDNPWKYKISWNPMNVVLAGKDGASYRQDGKTVEVPYEKLYDRNSTVDFPEIGKMAYYPNRDSLHYAALYQMEDVPTILRATLRHSEYCEGWQAIIDLGLTDNEKVINTDHLTYRDWTMQRVPHGQHQTIEEKVAAYLKKEKNARTIKQLKFLGLFNDEVIHLGGKTNAQIMLYVMTEKISMKPYDKDMVLLQHDVIYEHQNKTKKRTGYLIVNGEDLLHTAIAKTVGLPLGILAKLVLTGKVTVTGLHIPVMPEVYVPVLKELEEYNIRFKELES